MLSFFFMTSPREGWLRGDPFHRFSLSFLNHRSNSFPFYPGFCAIRHFQKDVARVLLSVLPHPFPTVFPFDTAMPFFSAISAGVLPLPLSLSFFNSLSSLRVRPFAVTRAFSSGQPFFPCWSLWAPFESNLSPSGFGSLAPAPDKSPRDSARVFTGVSATFCVRDFAYDVLTSWGVSFFLSPTHPAGFCVPCTRGPFSHLFLQSSRYFFFLRSLAQPVSPLIRYPGLLCWELTTLVLFFGPLGVCNVFLQL